MFLAERGQVVRVASVPHESAARYFFWELFDMHKSRCGLALMALFYLCGTAAEELPTVQIYKSPTCGCCTKWAGHLRQQGFTVQAKDLTNVEPIKREHSVPAQLRSCHTALLGGYVIEGHVPVSDILRLLKERPQISGIAVPGMPIGSPGMEGPNPEAYKVFSFDDEGNIRPFSTHQP